MKVVRETFFGAPNKVKIFTWLLKLVRTIQWLPLWPITIVKLQRSAMVHTVPRYLLQQSSRSSYRPLTLKRYLFIYLLLLGVTWYLTIWISGYRYGY